MLRPHTEIELLAKLLYPWAQVLIDEVIGQFPYDRINVLRQELELLQMFLFGNIQRVLAIEELCKRTN